MHYDELANWLDKALGQEIPDGVAAFCFNLYDNDNGLWSMELVGAGSFDPEDSDWACDEVTHLGTREELFVWRQDVQWEHALQRAATVLGQYLEAGGCAHLLKSRQGVAVGFVDGDLNLLYSAQGMA